MNDAKLERAKQLRISIGYLESELKHWSDADARTPPHKYHPITGAERKVSPESMKAWLEYRQRVIEQLTTERDMLKREYEVM